MFFPLCLPSPITIQGRFLGLVWYQDQLKFLRLLDKGEELQIRLSDTLEPTQLLSLSPWDWILVEAEWVGDLCQSERILRACSVTPLPLLTSGSTYSNPSLELSR